MMTRKKCGRLILSCDCCSLARLSGVSTSFVALYNLSAILNSTLHTVMLMNCINCIKVLIKVQQRILSK